MDPTRGYMKIIQDPDSSEDAKNKAMRALNEYLAEANKSELEAMHHTANTASHNAAKVIEAVADLGASDSSHIKPPRIGPPRIGRPRRPRPIATE